MYHNDMYTDKYYFDYEDKDIYSLTKASKSICMDADFSTLEKAFVDYCFKDAVASAMALPTKKSGTFKPMSEKTANALLACLPIRIILKTDTLNQYLGVVENKHILKWDSARVLILWSNKLHRNAIEEADEIRNKIGGEIYDPFLNDCPIEIDWERWANATHESEMDNAHFKMKGTA